MQGHDWVIIKLAHAGAIAGFDIDTSHFKGNHAPAASVEACFIAEDHGDQVPEHAEWTTILPKVSLKPHRPHLFSLRSPTPVAYNYLRLTMYPDGGIARFRVYGTITPLLMRGDKPYGLLRSCDCCSDPNKVMDLAFVGHGAQVISCSDDFFGKRGNLILPGRGYNMGDGWETKRSRVPDHTDWIVVRLGAPGFLETAEVDERSVICVLTHDPKFDVPVLKAALATEAGYIGAMGSRRTHNNRMARLKEEGVTDEQLARISSPIGLDIGARTPEETAIAIAAEIVALRTGHSGGRLAERSGPIHAREESATR